MKQIRVIHATPKAKTKILSQKRKTPNDSKGKSSQMAQKKRLETSSDSEDYEKKDLVDDKSDGLLNLGNSDDETQIQTCVLHQ